ncbi:MAG: hypothetical protein Q4A74_03910 [Cardiobacteriaceae bacterium]|nr:hypothetical protein [Cardiobacteriaceae bacterium]
MQKVPKPALHYPDIHNSNNIPMSSFFQQTAQAMINRHIDRFPLLKIDRIIDW